MRYLAIDYGDKRSGLAIGDDQTRIASPLQVIGVSDQHRLISHIKLVLDQHEVNALVVGLPLNMDGSESEQSRKVKLLAGQLERLLEMPVHLVDERLTSAAADQRMAGSELTYQQKKSRRDALAAAEILSDFFRSLDDQE